MILPKDPLEATRVWGGAARIILVFALLYLLLQEQAIKKLDLRHRALEVAAENGYVQRDGLLEEMHRLSQELADARQPVTDDFGSQIDPADQADQA